jgi:hypothetical protein
MWAQREGGLGRETGWASVEHGCTLQFTRGKERDGGTGWRDSQEMKRMFFKLIKTG